MSSRQQGFTIVEVILVIVVVGVLAFAGWRFLDARHAAQQTADTSTTEQVPEVNDTEDLDEAESYLQETDIDAELDTSELDEVME